MNRRIRGGKNVPPRYAAKIEQALSDHLRQGSLHLAGQTNTSINDSFTLQVETNTSDDAFFTSGVETNTSINDSFTLRVETNTSLDVYFYVRNQLFPSKAEAPMSEQVD